MKKRKKGTDTEILYLLPKKKRSLIHLLFSRTALIILLIILQIGIFHSLYNNLKDYFEWFEIAFGAFSVLMVFHLFSIDMDSTAKLSWLLILMIAPVPGAIFMLFTEKDLGHRAFIGRMRELTHETKNIIPQDNAILQDNDVSDSGTAALHKYLNKSGCFPIYQNTSLRYFPVGEDKYSAMLNELRKAKDFIFLEYFIIEEGIMWGHILKILADKVREGVDVRVMYDGMCEVILLTSDYPTRLQSLGIKCKPFSRIYPFISTNYNYRDHRKILVIDGKTAFTGGVNLSDEYINEIDKFGHWKDTAIMLKGDAVKSFTLMFLQIWNITEKNPEWDRFINIESERVTDGYIMPYCDSPLDNYKVGEMVYIDILNRAKRYVHIMTPYLILDNELETALKFAAQRGVDVKLIIPGIPDKMAIYALSKSYCKYLIDAGVEIYEYSPGFVHAKVFVSDDEKAVVGTINLDYRSLYHHFECAAYILGSKCIANIEADFNKTLKKCRRIDHNIIKHEKIIFKATGNIMRLAAPLY